jgi:hypothetical protein
MRVYIFGAGASKADNAPISSELLMKSFHTFPKDRRVKSVRYFLEHFFHTDCKQINSAFPSPEDVLNLIDASIIEQQDLSWNYNYLRLEELRNNFIYSIAKIIEHDLKDDYGKIHKSFITNLFSSTERTHKNTAFINLNYDILLDNSLIQLFDKNIDIDYCIDFSNSKQYEELPPDLQNRLADEWHNPRSGQELYLLKPHGSLNWIYCPNCQNIQITPKQKGAIPVLTEYTPCETDGSRQRAVIIAPSWYKNYSNPYITNIWLNCAHILKKATEIFFIGYSLPEADNRLRYLFVKNLYRKRGVTVPVYVVTRDSNNLPFLTSRYRSLFGNNLKFSLTGFEGYAKDPNNIDLFS